MKYKLTDNKKVINGITLYQIEAVKDIPKFGIKAGDLGGFIEKESNLSQEDCAWVYGSAQVYGNAQVYGSAWVSGGARVYGNAQVYGSAQVYGDAWVYGNAWVSGNAQVYGSAQVYGDAWVYGNAQVYGSAWVYGNAQVYGSAWVSGGALIISKLDLVYLAAPKFDLTLTNAGLSIGCECHSIEHWLSNYREIGTKNNFTEKEIEYYGKLIKTVIKMFKAQQELKEDVK